MDGEREAKRLRKGDDTGAGEEHGAMSSINSERADHRGQPGDRTSSELEESEGIRTEMTSLLEPDVDMGGVEDEGDDGPSVFNGSASIYPSSMMTRRLESNLHLRLVADSTEEESIDLNASTRSLMERYLDYHDRHGRRYCQHYFMPNDELEQTRLYLTHQVFLHVLNGEITTIPLKNPTKILDIGTGTGEWAMQMGERLPDCEVIGTDLSAIQPNCPPINVFFEIEDAELPWLRQPDSIDLVHLRNMSGAFRDWRFIYEQAFECLKPGGYLEIQEFDDGSNWSRFLPAFPPDSPVHAVARDLFIGCAKAGRPRGMGHVDAMYWIEAGFVDIKTTEHVLPLTMETGSAGKLWLMTVVDGFEALCLRPLTEYMGWDPDYAKKCCEEIAYDIARIARDPERSKGLTATVRVVSGRKPTAAEWADYEGRMGHETESTSDGRTVVAETTSGETARLADEADATMQGIEAPDLHGTDALGPTQSPEMDEVVATPDTGMESEKQADVTEATGSTEPRAGEPHAGEHDNGAGKATTGHMDTTERKDNQPAPLSGPVTDKSAYTEPSTNMETGLSAEHLKEELPPEVSVQSTPTEEDAMQIDTASLAEPHSQGPVAQDNTPTVEATEDVLSPGTTPKSEPVYETEKLDAKTETEPLAGMKPAQTTC